METVYPAAASALARGRRRRQATPRSRYRTAPVTFAEIKEVDEEQDVVEEADNISVLSERRRKPDELLELSREFAEFRRRRARRTALREPDEVIEGSSPSDGPSTSNASSSSETHSVAIVDMHEVSVVSKSHGQLIRSSSEPT